MRKELLKSKPYLIAQTMLCLAAALILAGCSETPNTPSQNGGMFRERNEGYSLLYKLMSDNGDVDKIFILKHADEPVGGLVKEIAAACKSAKAQMDEWPKANNRIEFDVADLPKIEQAARDQESSAQAKNLLTSSDKPFETKLIFNEAEAMGYAANLCEALLKHEDDPGHKDFLTKLQKQCSDFRDRLMELLTVK
jgi:hypothetical protein